jgi:hypothetical protein
MPEAPGRPIPADVPGSRSLYPRLLGAAWDSLAPSVRRLHADDDAVATATGCFQVRRAPGRLPGLILDAARVPATADAVRVRLAIAADEHGERWERSFDGGRPLVTLQRALPGGLLGERIGPLELRFRLLARDGALLFRQEGISLCVGAWRVPLPEWLTFRVDGRAGPVERASPAPDAAEDGGPAARGAFDEARVDVRVRVPGGRLLFAYRGVMRFAARGSGALHEVASDA